MNDSPDVTYSNADDLDARLRADREGRGGLKPLSEYLKLYPGAEDFVAERYVSFKKAASHPTDGGTRFGSYKIVKELGRGGQGCVFLAEDERLKRKVALKVLTNVALTSPMQVARFKREAEIASKLDHPGICGVYDVGTENETPFIAMRYVEGETLAAVVARSSLSSDGGTAMTSFNFSATTFGAADDDPSTHVEDRTQKALLNEGPKTSPEAAAVPPSVAESRAASSSAPPSRRDVASLLLVIEKAARALHAAHEAGVVHRDVKPGNIMVTKEGEPVVLDFGLARDDEAEDAALTRSGDVFGTPAYMAPEQLAGGRLAVDRRCDVYALGVTLYECLTLNRPFDAPTRQGLYNAILTKPAEDPRRLRRWISVDLKVVIETALEKDRDRRYRTAEAFAEDLRRVRESLPIAARAITPVGRFVRWAKRSPGVAAALSALILTLAGGLAATLAQKNRADRNAVEASLSAAEARLQAERAEASLLAWNRLADRRRLEELVAEADGPLWPATPTIVPAIEAWIVRAEALRLALPAHVAALAALREVATKRGEHFEFENAEDRFRHDNLAVLTESLESLCGDPAPGRVTIAEMRARLETARGLRARTVDARQKEWEAARSRVAADARFGGFALAPQAGLVPLGPDPNSGLEEFGDVLSGDPPVRDASGKLAMIEASGLVFVFVPGGTFTMGAQSDDENAPHYDRAARADEGPPHDVTLAPFFVSKFEMTQGQWLRATGRNPSHYAAGGTSAGKERTLVHPVEQADYAECMETTRRLGMTLPTEAQWEYAARAGTDTPWSTGIYADDLVRYANIADQFCRLNGGLTTLTYESWNDGWSIHAPVGSFSPNAFGVHDAHGNVFEWCRDAAGSYEGADHAPGDGFRTAEGTTRVIRGGGFSFRAIHARSSFRGTAPGESRTTNIGLRPVRDVSPR